MYKREEVSRRIRELVDDLPLFPTEIDKLLAAAVKPSEDNTKVIRLIETDPKLRAELLALAGPYFGREQGFETLEDAVGTVGIQPLVQLIGISYAKSAIQEEFAALKYLNEYVEHGEEISICCRILTAVSGLARQRSEIYALAGLIHDVGRLAILVGTNRTSAHVLGTMWDKMASVIHDERTDLGTDHCEAGANICRKWNFSLVIQEAVARHHSPLVDSDFSFAGGLIFVSHFVSVSDPSGDIISTALPTELMTRLNLTDSDFSRAKEIYQSRTQGNG